MSCSTCCKNPCSCDEACDPNHEPLASALDNFITAFFGTLSKSCVDGKVVWILPCDLESGSADFPRNAGEGLACYFLRFIQATAIGSSNDPGKKGYRFTSLSATSLILFRFIDVLNQDFGGTLTAPVTIYLTSNAAVNGDEFYISFDNVVITATNTLSINSDATVLATYSTPGTINGYVKAVYTGTVWKLTDESINIT